MNRQITLAARPVGMPKESDFSLVESPIPHPARGEVLVQALYLSVDPYVRGRLTGVTTYARGLDLGEVIVGGVVGRVLDSSDPRYAAGRHRRRHARLAGVRRGAGQVAAQDRLQQRARSRRPCTSSGCRA